MQLIVTSIIYLILDIIWISLMTPILYKPMFEKIQKSALQPNMIYAVIAYLILVFTIITICEPLSKQYKHKYIAYGLVGFVIYSIYNLTNAVVFSNYSLKTIIIDTLWGTAVFSSIGLLNSIKI